jgi:hypothetical protein
MEISKKFLGMDQVEAQDLSAILKIYNKITDDVLLEVVDRASPDSTVEEINFKFKLNIPPKAIDSSEAVFIATFLKNEKTGQLLIDPQSKQTIIYEKQLFALEDDEYLQQESPKQSPINSERVNLEDMVATKTYISNFIAKTDDYEKLTQWEHLLDDSLRELRGNIIGNTHG